MDPQRAGRFLAPKFLQHTPAIADGAGGLKSHILSLKEKYPAARRQVKRVMVDGDYVMLQVLSMRTPGAVGEVVGEIFRLEKGRLAEQWEVTHPIPETPHPKNHNWVFETSPPAAVAVSARQMRRNKDIAIRFYNAALNEKDWPKASAMIGGGYVQHSISMEDGPAGFEDLVNRIKTQFPQNRGEIKNAFADGDMVVLQVHVTRTRDQRGYYVMELMRLKDEKVVEHWDIFQLVPETSANSNGMF